MTVSSFDMTFTARDGAAYDGRMSTPAGDGTATAILIIPAIFGTDAEMEGLIEDFARDGFLTAAPDYFHRSVPGPTADFQAALDRMNSFQMAQGLMDMEDCMAQLRSHPRCSGKLAVLGFCFGGSFAFLAGTRYGADAVGACHGTRIHSVLDEADRLQVPTSLHYGDDDPHVPMEQVEMVKAALADKEGCDVVIHAGGQHNFSMPTKAGYDAAVAKAARDAVIACFSRM